MGAARKDSSRSDDDGDDASAAAQVVEQLQAGTATPDTLAAFRRFAAPFSQKRANLSQLAQARGATLIAMANAGLRCKECPLNSAACDLLVECLEAVMVIEQKLTCKPLSLEKMWYNLIRKMLEAQQFERCLATSERLTQLLCKHTLPATSKTKRSRVAVHEVLRLQALGSEFVLTLSPLNANGEVDRLLCSALLMLVSVCARARLTPEELTQALGRVVPALRQRLDALDDDSQRQSAFRLLYTDAQPLDKQGCAREALQMRQWSLAIYNQTQEYCVKTAADLAHKAANQYRRAEAGAASNPAVVEFYSSVLLGDDCPCDWRTMQRPPQELCDVLDDWIKCLAQAGDAKAHKSLQASVTWLGSGQLSDAAGAMALQITHCTTQLQEKKSLADAGVPTLLADLNALIATSPPDPSQLAKWSSRLLGLIKALQTSACCGSGRAVLEACNAYAGIEEAITASIPAPKAVPRTLARIQVLCNCASHVIALDGGSLSSAVLGNLQLARSLTESLEEEGEQCQGWCINALVSCATRLMRCGDLPAAKTYAALGWEVAEQWLDASKFAKEFASVVVLTSRILSKLGASEDALSTVVDGAGKLALVCSEPPPLALVQQHVRLALSSGAETEPLCVALASLRNVPDEVLRGAAEAEAAVLGTFASRAASVQQVKACALLVGLEGGGSARRARSLLELARALHALAHSPGGVDPASAHESLANVDFSSCTLAKKVGRKGTKKGRGRAAQGGASVPSPVDVITAAQRDLEELEDREECSGDAAWLSAMCGFWLVLVRDGDDSISLNDLDECSSTFQRAVLSSDAVTCSVPLSVRLLCLDTLACLSQLARAPRIHQRVLQMLDSVLAAEVKTPGVSDDFAIARARVYGRAALLFQATGDCHAGTACLKKARALLLGSAPASDGDHPDVVLVLDPAEAAECLAAKPAAGQVLLGSARVAALVDVLCSQTEFWVEAGKAHALAATVSAFGEAVEANAGPLELANWCSVKAAVALGVGHFEQAVASALDAMRLINESHSQALPPSAPLPARRHHEDARQPPSWVSVCTSSWHTLPLVERVCTTAGTAYSHMSLHREAEWYYQRVRDLASSLNFPLLGDLGALRHLHLLLERHDVAKAEAIASEVNAEQADEHERSEVDHLAWQIAKAAIHVQGRQGTEGAEMLRLVEDEILSLVTTTSALSPNESNLLGGRARSSGGAKARKGARGRKSKPVSPLDDEELALACAPVAMHLRRVLYWRVVGAEFSSKFAFEHDSMLSMVDQAVAPLPPAEYSTALVAVASALGTDSSQPKAQPKPKSRSRAKSRRGEDEEDEEDDGNDHGESAQLVVEKCWEQTRWIRSPPQCRAVCRLVLDHHASGTGPLLAACLLSPSALLMANRLAHLEASARKHSRQDQGDQQEEDGIVGALESMRLSPNHEDRARKFQTTLKAECERQLGWLGRAPDDQRPAETDMYEDLPEEWTVVAIDVSSDRKSIRVCRLERDCPPVVLTRAIGDTDWESLIDCQLPQESSALGNADMEDELEQLCFALEDNDDGSVASPSQGSAAESNHCPRTAKDHVTRAKDAFEAIMTESARTTAATAAVKTEQDKREWWSSRSRLNEQMHMFVKIVERDLVSDMSVLMAARCADDAIVERVAQACEELARLVKAPDNSSSYALVRSIVNYCFVHSHCLTEKDSPMGFHVTNSLAFLVYSKAFSALDRTRQAKLTKIKDWLLDQATRSSSTKRRGKGSSSSSSSSRVVDAATPTRTLPLLLCVCPELQFVPWESLPCLRDKPVGRLPCLALALAHAKALGEEDRVECNVRDCFYAINPSGDLKRTQQVLGPQFARRKHWQGTLGKASKEEILQGAQAHDLYIYSGHGAGEQFASPWEIERGAPVVSLLIGCSSGKFRDAGSFEPSTTPLQYLVGGGANVVANMWDVTDVDIDRFTQRLLDEWVDGDCDCLLTAVARSRSACRLPYLIGSAPVCYGVPVYRG